MLPRRYVFSILAQSWIIGRKKDLCRACYLYRIDFLRCLPLANSARRELRSFHPYLEEKAEFTKQRSPLSVPESLLKKRLLGLWTA